MSESTPAPSGVTRLSAPNLRKRPRRELTSEEAATLRRVAGALIPAGDADGEIAADTIADFDALAQEALAIMDPAFDSITDALEQLQHVRDDELFAWLRGLDQQEPNLFYSLSLLVTSIYLYSPEVEAELGYPHPHRNPAPENQFVEELETGLLNPVIERGSIYVPID